MQGSSSLFKRWIPALLWMALIFTASGDSNSGQHSSRIIQPILLWISPEMTEEQISRIVFAVRKAAHVVEYAILACLCWLGCQRRVNDQGRPWKWNVAFLAWSISTVYAISDELHQTMVPSRVGNPWDVLLDSAGAASGLLILWAVGRWRKSW